MFKIVPTLHLRCQKWFPSFSPPSTNFSFLAITLKKSALSEKKQEISGSQGVEPERVNDRKTKVIKGEIL